MILDMRLIFLLLAFTSGTICFTPQPRGGQTQNLVGSRIYYFGGAVNRTYFYNDTFYLDLSKPFQTTNPPWVLLNTIGSYNAAFYPASIVSPFNSSIIYSIGGLNHNTSEIALYTFNCDNNEWKTLISSGDAPVERQEIMGVVDKYGKVYIFGGTMVNDYVTYNSSFRNELDVLDITKNVWTIYSTSQSYPNPRTDYTATLLENGIIIYIGGREYVDFNNETQRIVDFNKLSLFHTDSLTWSSVNVTSNSLQGRMLHTAVLAKNGHIIVYGGVIMDLSPVNNSLVILDTSSTPYSWYIPASNNSSPPLFGHSATFFNDYMIVTFGLALNSSLGIWDLNKELYILDTTNYQWVDSFAPSSVAITLPSSSTTTNDDKILIGFSIAFGLLGFILLYGLIAYLVNKKIVSTQDHNRNTKKLRKALVGEEICGHQRTKNQSSLLYATA